MSYQVLARKYRPKSFETLVGQEHVVRALSHALEQQRLHHAYLFTGTRGVGKTTLSRILAKSFNCETGITAHPCGVCEACTAIDAGRFVDYIEMDAASNRGVDEMASLLEQAIYAPSNARFKVYMIDEVHMLTNHAFNAMLKTLEEPPEHVKFILATTDPQKIPVTVLSRCLQFNLKQMPPGHIVGHLDNILGQEQIEFELPALRLLAQGAHGSMRDALSLTDQAIAYAAGKVTLDAVQGMLGALDQSYLIRLLDGLVAQDGKALLDVADEMAARSLSYKAALQDLGSLLHQIAIAQLVPAAVADDIPEREQVLRLAQCFAKEEIQLFYQIAVHGRNELALAPDEYAGFSMTLLRMLAFKPTTGEQDAIPPAGGRPSAPQALPSNAGAGRAVLAGGSAPVGMTATPAPAAPTVSAAPAATSIAGRTPVATPQAAAASVPAVQTATPVAATPAAPATGVRQSPVLAALAAARAASGKQATPGARPAPAPTIVADKAPAPAPVAKPIPAPVMPAAVVAPPPAPAMPVPDVVAAAVSATPAPAQPASPIARTPVSAPAPMIAEQDAQSAGMDDMPPPWDEEMFFESAPAKPMDAGRGAGSAASRSAMPAARQEDEGMLAVSSNNGNGSSSISSRQDDVRPAEKAKPEIAATKPEALGAIVADRQISNLPVPELNWDGFWPNLAASLPMRGVAQQLAQQSELVSCRQDGNAHVFRLRVPLPTLLSSGSLDKLTAALTERFEKNIRVETEIGAVEQTANAQAVAEREVRQQQAEASIQGDSFVQTLMREFGATIVTGSVRPV
ncbi:DNA polymerase III subunit gamma/tau [Undibacterium sp. CY18W]|uniref:DNA polymerase III subunit gamma/tau n=1 Tax=Undibacterium hunanense TaxID=2762292 RepID=A0ABR6ZNE2_9BURK|nr:DNA polymerase III subunit gamma/tau [Undibacterium hunanense]MBC3917416.1 DNA polymerase III subunit gamma/tau [Undibacterium hunanense]